MSSLFYNKRLTPSTPLPNVKYITHIHSLYGSPNTPESPLNV